MGFPARPGTDSVAEFLDFTIFSDEPGPSFARRLGKIRRNYGKADLETVGMAFAKL